MFSPLMPTANQSRIFISFICMLSEVRFYVCLPLQVLLSPNVVSIIFCEWIHSQNEWMNPIHFPIHLNINCKNKHLYLKFLFKVSHAKPSGWSPNLFKTAIKIIKSLSPVFFCSLLLVLLCHVLSTWNISDHWHFLSSPAKIHHFSMCNTLTWLTHHYYLELVVYVSVYPLERKLLKEWCHSHILCPEWLT